MSGCWPTKLTVTAGITSLWADATRHEAHWPASNLDVKQNKAPRWASAGWLRYERIWYNDRTRSVVAAARGSRDIELQLRDSSQVHSEWGVASPATREIG